MKALSLVLFLAACGGGGDDTRELQPFEACSVALVDNQCPFDSIIPANLGELRK